MTPEDEAQLKKLFELTHKRIAIVEQRIDRIIGIIEGLNKTCGTVSSILEKLVKGK